MKLEQLVPALELCKKIPRGNFDDSMAVWVVRKKCDIVDIMCREDYDWSKYENYPAPTLQELLKEINEAETWHICASLHFCKSSRKNKSPASDLLKVWLVWKGLYRLEK